MNSAVGVIDGVHSSYERAARNYCQRMGIDPEARVVVGHERVRILGAKSQAITVERWRLVAEELYDLSVRLVALRDSRQQPVVATEVKQ